MEQINDTELQALIQRVVRQQLDAFQRQQKQEQGPTNSKPAPRMPKRPHPKRKKEKTPPPPAKPTNKAVQYLAYVLNQGVIHPNVPTTVILTPNGEDSAQITYNPYNGSFFVSYKGRVNQYYLVTKYNNDIQALANDLYASMSRENSRTQSPINVQKKNPNNPPFTINKMVGK